MSHWALSLHYLICILFGSSAVTCSPLKHYLQFLRHQDHDKKDLGPIRHASSPFHVRLQNISFDEEKLCRETYANHVSNALELLQISLCTVKDRVQSDFQRTDAASRNVWNELPTDFDSTILMKIEDVLSKAFTVIHVLQQPYYWNETETPLLEKNTSISFARVGAQPIQDKWVDQINAEIEKIRIAENEATLFAKGGVEHRNNEELIKHAYHTTKMKIEDKIHELIKSTRKDTTASVKGNLSDEIALGAIRALPLKDYRILHDAKKDFHVSELQRRTRSHIGIVHGDIADGSILQHAYRSVDERDLDSTMLFWYNLKAVAALTKKTDDLIKYNQILHLFTATDTFTSVINSSEFNTTLTQYGAKSFAQSTAEAASLDANVSMKNIEGTALSAKHSLRMRKRYRRDLWRSLVLTEQDASASRISSTQSAVESKWESEKLNMDSNIDAAIEAIALIGKILSLRNHTARELFRLREAAKSEATLERTKIEYEAQEERENEASTLKRVQVMGEAATKEVIEIIQVVFTNLAQGFIHICYTQHGRNQFFLFACAAALLAFSLVFSKELVSLLLLTLQIMAKTPKIVREYGNLNFLSRRRSLLLAASSKPVLPPRIERRLEDICKANIKAYRSGAPMRHLLICGKSGTGKSLVATTIARCMINLPYAVMSGADIAPLGRLGPLELRRLLTWANNRPKGAVIIIDEAESALGSRIRDRTKSGINAGLVLGDVSDISGEADGIGYARDSLNVLLSLTGCTFTKFMLIITTSHPEKLDEAILDRMDDTIEIPLPGEPERLEMLRVEFNKRFCKSSTIHPSHSRMPVGHIAYEDSFDPEKELKQLASNKMTLDFSGREIKKVLHAVSSKIYSGEMSILSKAQWDEITQDVCESITAKKNKERVF